MLHRKFIFKILLLASIFSGCSSIEMKVPANRFDSPEARGQQLKGHVDPIVLQGSHHLTIVDDFTRKPPRTQSPEFSRSDLNYQLGAGLGILERLDVEFKSPVSAPTTLSLKYQALGETELQSKKGNFSLAATLAGGFGADADKATQFLGTVVSEFSMRVWQWDAALIAGYRVHEKALLYSGPFYTQYVLSGDITQPAGGNTVFHFAGKGRQLGWSMGMQFDVGDFLIKINEAWANATFSTQSISSFYTGVLGGVRF